MITIQRQDSEFSGAVPEGDQMRVLAASPEYVGLTTPVKAPEAKVGPSETPAITPSAVAPKGAGGLDLKTVEPKVSEPTTITPPAELANSYRRFSDTLKANADIAALVQAEAETTPPTDDEKQQQAASNLVDAAEHQPEQQAQRNENSRVLGVDPSVTDGDPRQAEISALKAGMKLQNMDEWHPAVVDWMTDPYNARVGRQDISNLNLFAAAIGGTAQGAQEGYQNYRLNQLSDILRRGGVLSPEQESERYSLEQDLATNIEGDNGVFNFFRGAGSFTSSGALQLGDTAFRAAPVVAAGTLTGAVAGFLTTPGELTLRTGGAIIGGARGFMMSRAAAGLAGGFDVGAEQAGGQAYREFLKLKSVDGRPINPAAARAAATVVAGAGGVLGVGALEALATSMGRTVFKGWAKNAVSEALVKNPSFEKALAAWAKNYGTAVASQGAIMGGFELSNIVGEELAKTYDTTKLFDDTTSLEALQRVGKAGIAGITSSALPLLLLSGATSGPELLRLKKGVDEQQRLEQINAAADKSTLQGGDKQSFAQRAMQSVGITKKDGIVYVDSAAFNKTLTEQGKTPAGVAEALGVAPQFKAGETLAIPMDKYLGGLDSEARRALIDSTTLSPDGLTKGEVQQLFTKLTTETQNVQKKAQDEFNAKSQAFKDRTLIEQAVTDALVKADTSKGIAKQQARLYGAFFSTLGELTGKSPLELYKTYKPNIGKSFDSSLFTGRANDRGNFSPADNGITLFKAKDPSTFLHESGHLFGKIVNDVAAGEGASPEIKALSEAILKWVDAKPGEVWTEAQQEKWATAFEKYLQDGAAPNKGLVPAFRQYSRWLSRLYNEHTALGGSQQGEVAGIFGRLLGASEAVAQEPTAQLPPLFKSAKEAGMTDKEYAEYIKLNNKSLERAQDTLFGKAYDRVKGERLAEYRKVRAEEKAAVEKQVNAMPWSRLQRFLSTGIFEYVAEKTGKLVEVGDKQKVGMNRAELEALVAEKVITQKQLDEMNPRFISKDGVPLEELAQLFEYPNKYKMMEELTAKVTRDELIQGLLEQRMAEKYAPLLSAENIAAAAKDALLNDDRFKTLQTEISALDKLAGRTGTDMNLLRERVSTRLRDQQYGTLSPDKYLRDAKKAANDAQAFLASGRYAKAAEAKLRQTEAFLAHREATMLERRADRQVEKLRDYATNERARAQIALGSQEYLARIDQVLDMLSFTKQSKASLALAKGSLGEWVKQQNDNGFYPLVPEALLSQQKLNYKEASIGAIDDVYTAVENWAHIAKLEKEAKDITIANSRANKAAEISKSLLDNNKSKAQPAHVSSSNKGFDRARGLREWNTSLRIPEFFFRAMDGDNPVGALTRLIFQPIVKAANKTALELTKAFGELEKITKVYENGELAADVFVKELNLKMARRDILMVALQMGNEGNKTAFYEGNFNEAQTQSILSYMTKRDWDVAHAIGRLMDSQRERIQEHNRRITGLDLQMVEPSPVVTPHGTYDGWYFPLAYEPRENSVETALQDSGIDISAMGQYSGAIGTRHEYRMQRVGSGGRKVAIRGWGTIDSHLRRMFTDLNLFEPLQEVTKLLKDPSVASAMEATMNPEQRSMINWWLKETIGTNPRTSFVFDKAASFLRRKTTFAQLGYKVTTALVNVSGFFNAVDELGPQYATVGLTKAFNDPLKVGEKMAWIESVSDFMATRRRNIDHNLASLTRKLDASKPQSAYENGAYAMIGHVDALVALPSWMGGYQKAIESLGLSHEDAVQYADSVVRTTQGTGLSYGHSKIISGAGSDTIRLMVMFQSYTNVVYNRMLRHLNNVKANGVASLPAATAGVLNLLVAPALMEQVLKRNFPKADDEEKWNKIASFIALQGAGYIPIAGSALRALVTGQDFQMTPADTVVRNASLLLKDINQGEVTGNTLKAGLNTLGLFTNIPTSQLSVTLDALGRQANGEDMSFLDYFIRPPRE